MKKRIIRLSLVLALMLCLSVSVFAESQLWHITDDAGILTESQNIELETYAENISQDYGVGVYVVTVDNYEDGWDGEVGLVTKPFEHLEVDADNTFGALCGPPVMYRFVVEEMRKKGIPYDRIYMSFERHMKCGMGKCGHCQVGHQYVCIDGPVFNYWEAKNIQGSM